MSITKERLLERIDDLRKAQAVSLTPFSRSMQLAERRLILDVVEFLLIATVPK